MTKPSPAPRSGILDINAYVPGGHDLPGIDEPIVLSANETPLGPSPAAVEAFRALAGNLARYPDGSAEQLRTAIARVYGLNADNIVCGCGSDELISLLAQCYLSPGDEAIFTEHGFLVYRIATLAAGATPVVAPESNLTTDVDAILKCVSDRTKVVFLANPNNPTGTYIPIDEVRRLREGLRSDIVLVLDAAYAEYVSRNDYEAGLELVSTSTNTVMTRTFSKIYGLAALRLGWAYCPAEIAGVLNRTRGPFNVNAAAIAAGTEAIADIAHLDRARAHNDQWLPWTTSELRRLGLEVTESVGNFILIHFDESGEKTAAAADAHLRQKGIIVRGTGGYGLGHCLRMTIGTEAENRAVVDALREFMAGS